MPFRHRHHWFMHLALLSALLLATVPTMGRLLQTIHASGATAATAALCTVRGLEHVPLPDGTAAFGLPAAVEPATDHGDGDHPRHAQNDCAYCPLLSGLLLPALVAHGLPWTPAPRHQARRQPAAIPLAASIPGLGSRGPPTLSAVFR